MYIQVHYFLNSKAQLAAACNGVVRVSSVFVFPFRFFCLSVRSQPRLLPILLLPTCSTTLVGGGRFSETLLRWTYSSTGSMKSRHYRESKQQDSVVLISTTSAEPPSESSRPCCSSCSGSPASGVSEAPYVRIIDPALGRSRVFWAASARPLNRSSTSSTTSSPASSLDVYVYSD